MKVIYQITCLGNGKFYIGSTVNKTVRWARHRRQLRQGTHPNKNMQASWNAYGEDCFVFEVLEEVDSDIALFSAEQVYLDKHAGAEDCFNWAKYAGAPMRGKRGEETPNFGKTMPPEVRKKISKSLSGDKNPNFGKPVSPEMKEKLRQANLAYPHKDYRHTPEAIEKIRASSLGREVSKESREKRSKALMGHEVPLEVRIRISKALSGEGNYWYGKKRPDHGEKVSRPVQATKPDGEVLVYRSISDLRAALGLKPSTVNRALKSGRPLSRGPLVGWQFKDVDPD